VRPLGVVHGLRLAGALVLLVAMPRLQADTPAAPGPSPAPAPRIVIEPMRFDFGTLRPGGAVEKEFIVHNHGRAELVIESLVSSCGCTAALTDSKTVKPGASTVLRLRLTAPDDPGRLQKSLLVKSNDPAHGTVELKVEAVVVGKASPAPR
jgi:Protein of unknown function (DUF1573)